MGMTTSLLAWTALLAPPALDGHDWPSYNADVLGTRHNAAEKSLGKANVGKLVEKWRFESSLLAGRVLGPVHATPIVVNGHVYIATAVSPAVYKLTPDGKQKWAYFPKGPKAPKDASWLPEGAFLASPLVTADTVFACDLAGFIHALDRKTGKPRWVVNTREGPFPGAHSSNALFASPILAEGKLIVAGGGYEHAIAIRPGHKCCTGRGFVAALDPKTGKALWKYDVGEAPQELKPPVTIKDGGREQTFYYGPSTSSVWSTPSYDDGLIFFGTDTNNSPRQPTKDNPSLASRHSCAVIAVRVKDGKEVWVTQVNPGDVWNFGLRTYDPATGLYKDQSVGDTPKPYTVTHEGKAVRVVGVGCKNGVFYVMEARTGKILAHTPKHTAAPSQKARPGPRVLALPGAAGGLQTGCATDGKAVYVNGMDMPMLGVSLDPALRFQPPTGGRVTAISLDTKKELWRHERPKVKEVGKFRDVGDPVASGIALANGVGYFTAVVSGQLVAVDLATGSTLKEVKLGPVWSGPAVSRGRVYVGIGNILFSPFDPKEAFFPKSLTGAVVCFGLPDKDEVDRLGAGDE
jgi:glucose dehydrogenase